MIRNLKFLLRNVDPSGADTNDKMIKKNKEKCSIDLLKIYKINLIS